MLILFCSFSLNMSKEELRLALNSAKHYPTTVDYSVGKSKRSVSAKTRISLIIQRQEGPGYIWKK